MLLSNPYCFSLSTFYIVIICDIHVRTQYTQQTHPQNCCIFFFFLLLYFTCVIFISIFFFVVFLSILITNRKKKKSYLLRQCKQAQYGYNCVCVYVLYLNTCIHSLPCSCVIQKLKCLTAAIIMVSFSTALYFPCFCVHCMLCVIVCMYACVCNMHWLETYIMFWPDYISFATLFISFHFTSVFRAFQFSCIRNFSVVFHSIGSTYCMFITTVHFFSVHFPIVPPNKCENEIHCHCEYFVHIHKHMPIHDCITVIYM